jgi:hypothetical protein
MRTSDRHRIKYVEAQKKKKKRRYVRHEQGRRRAQKIGMARRMKQRNSNEIMPI